MVRFAGVGNIAAAVIPQSGPVRRLVSYAGTAGHQVRKILEFTYPWDSRSLLVMHSDGLQIALVVRCLSRTDASAIPA